MKREIRTPNERQPSMSIRKSIKPQWIALPWLVAAACSSSSGNSTTQILTSVATATTAECPNGGVSILSGMDTNGNGTLDASEVTSTQTICNGTTQTPSHASLISTTMLAVGNSHCPEGGTEIDSGLDNGAGGGTADDGILQPGEITSTQYVCAGATTPSALVATTTLSVGDANCPNGGVEIDSGLDDGSGGGTAGDGILQSGEITSTQYVCSGSSTTGSLTTTTQLASGNSHCPAGGTEIDSGLDNGANGAVAGDGILETGEITSSQFVCDGIGEYTDLYVGAMTPPSGPAGASTIDTSGGVGANGSGGSAGFVNLEIDQGTLGGHAKIFNTGVVAANFTIPDIDFNQGVIPFEVKQDTTLNIYSDQNTGLDSGDDIFLVAGDPNVYENVADTATPVTSLDIDSGTTLTFSSNDGNNAISLTLQRDIRNAGAIVAPVASDGISTTSLNITVSNYYGETGSSISLDGQTATGGNGGSLQLECKGWLINRGNISAVGAAGDHGGAGGSLSLYTNIGAGVFNTGLLTSSGGAGANGNGGSGGTIQLSGDYAGTFNGNSLTADGGAGTTLGGSGACTASRCRGGSGGEVDFTTQGGADLLNSGSIDISGGDADNGTGVGGNGANIEINSNDSAESQNANTNLPAGSIRFSGSLTTRGGDGAIGGGGGQINFELSSNQLPLGQEIELRGYTDVIMNGGSASTVGGNGGELQVQQDNPAQSPGSNNSNYGPAGAAINYANVSVRGGDGAQGGTGGSVLLTTQRNTNFNATFEIAFNAGTIDTSGGATSTDGDGGSSGGQIEFDGISGVQNFGALSANGGSTSGANSQSIGTSNINFTSDEGFVRNNGTLTADGGAATGVNGRGGSAGSINIFGNGVINTAAITCTGGDASDAMGIGGSGGNIQLYSSVEGPSMNSGALDVAAGANVNDSGAAAGPGSIVIDGATITP